MKVPISWLKKYIKVDEGSIDDLLHRLTLAGTEVESVQTQGNWEGIIVGQVSEVSKHPNADRLNLVKVNSGDSELLDVVCGANNLYVDQKVAFAPVGSKLFSPKSKKMETLKKSKIRGEDKKKLWKCNISKNMKAYDTTSLQLPKYCKDLKTETSFPTNKLGEWTVFKIGIKNSMIYQKET